MLPNKRSPVKKAARKALEDTKAEKKDVEIQVS
jgi:hypothetical protein